MLKKFFLSLVFFITISNVVIAESSSQPVLKSISPGGEMVDPPSRIYFYFKSPMIPLGKMERDAAEIPITIEPAVDCSWRWTSTSILACQVPQDKQLAFATEYKIKVDASFANEKGETLGKTIEHKFKTRIAAVEYSTLAEWENEGMPLIRVDFAQAMSHKLLAKNIFIQAGSEQYQLHAVAFNNGKPIEGAGEDEEFKTWQLKPVKKLPSNTKFDLMIQAETGVDQKTKKSDAKAVNTFHTFSAFKFVGVECIDLKGKKMLINSKHPQAKQRGCDPNQQISLAFTSPILGKDIKGKIAVSPGFKSEKAWNYLDDYYSRRYESYEPKKLYHISLPNGLKANTTYQISSENIGFWKKLWRRITRIFTGKPLTNIYDEFGRFLEKPFSVTVYVDHRQPKYVFGYETAIIEQQVESDFPIYVNNLDSFSINYNAVNAKEAWSGAITHKLEKVKDIQYAHPLGLKGILKDKSGALFGTINTDPKVPSSYEGDNQFFTQLTPYNIHFKYGYYNSVAWVTDLKTGLPIENAEITMYRDNFKQFKGKDDKAFVAKTDKGGLAILQGLQKFDPKNELKRHNNATQPNVFIMATKGDDMALLPITWNFSSPIYQIPNSYKFTRYEFDKNHIVAWGTSAQGIYRVGDTIQYKMYVRDNNLTTLQAAPVKGKYHFIVKDPLDKVIYENQDVALDAFGGFAGELKIAESAAIGWYKFLLYDAEDIPESEWMERKLFGSFNVLVSDFTPASFKVLQEVNGDQFQTGDEVKVQSKAQLYAGGAYKDAEFNLNATLDEQYFNPKDQRLQQFTFTKNDSLDNSIQVFNKISKLDDNGEAKLSFKLSNQNVPYGKLHIETAVEDERGKKIAKEQVFNYYGVDRLVGIHPTQWVFNSNKEAEIEYAVVDINGKIIADAEVDITIEQDDNSVARVKSAGSAYGTVVTPSWSKVAECHETSTVDIAKCKFTPKQAGTYKVNASVKDSKGNKHQAEEKIWVTGSDYVLWDDIDNISLSLVAEHQKYKVGDKAKILVKNPYPGAEALITVERYGVITSFVKKMETSSEIIELPITEDYFPGVYVSVIVTSPRIKKPVTNNGLDLGKPAYKMGYLKFDVSNGDKQLQVGVKIEKDLYKPRQKVKAKLHAEPIRNNKKEPIEFVVAVVDESVLDLNRAGANYYDPFKGFYKLDGLDVQNYTLLTRLIGRQKFEKKGANQGGDGGVDLGMRDTFKFVTYWNPNLKANANGDAVIEFEVPDNLTNWRVIAMAVTATDKMGVGAGDFKVSLPTEIRPVMPNQVAEGDKVKAGFRVINRMDKDRVINVEIKSEGNLLTGANELKQQVSVKAFDNADIWVDLSIGKVAGDAKEGQVTFKASARDVEDGDATVHNLQVLKMRTMQKVAQYGSMDENSVTHSLEYPKDIYTDVGGFKINLSPTIVGNITGAFNYMKNYPYQCLEQRLSKGLMALYYEKTSVSLNKDFTWPESKQLITGTLEEVVNFQAPSGGMAYFVAKDEYVDPYLSVYTLAALKQFQFNQYPVPTVVMEKLNAYLKGLLKENSFPEYYTEGMIASVRTYIIATLSNEVALAELTRLKPQLEMMNLSTQAQFLKAGLNIIGGEEMAKTAAELILSSSTHSAGEISFSKSVDHSFERILGSQTKDQCEILDAFLDYGKTEEGAKLIGEVPVKLAATISSMRGKKDNWNSTQENVFCTNALIKYSSIYEKQAPNYKVTVAVDDEKLGTADINSKSDKEQKFSKPFTFTDAGRKLSVKIDKVGNGRLYYNEMIEYASLKSNLAPVNAGLEVVKEYRVKRGDNWELLRNPISVKRGELVLVDILVKAPSPYEFVVLEDYIPGGFEGVNNDLATTSTADLRKIPANKNWIDTSISHWSFYHREMNHDKMRFYSDYLIKGTHHVNYMMQAIAEGEFFIKPTYAERMYNPDIYGLGVEMKLKVLAKN